MFEAFFWSFGAVLGVGLALLTLLIIACAILAWAESRK